MHAKKRLELIIEKPAYRRASKILEDAGVKGYTAFSAMAGFGAHNRWERGTDLSASRDMIMVVSVLDEEIVGRVIENLENLIGNHIGLLSLSDVTVLRPEKF